MAVKNDVQVVIDGKVITLSGYESNDYLQKIASYIDNRIKEFVQNDNYRRQNYDMQHTLIELNLADDYFKAKKQISILEEELRAKDKELYELKHELISAQIKLESSEEQVKSLQQDLNENSKKIVRLETELKKK